MEKNFRYSKKARLINLLLFNGMAIVAVITSVIRVINSPQTLWWPSAIFFSAFFPPLIFLNFSTLRLKIQVTSHSIIIRRYFKEHILDFKDIKGYQQTPHGLLLIPTYTTKFQFLIQDDILKQEGFREWIEERFNNLTPKSDLDEILQNPQFGRDEEERLKNFKRSYKRFWIIHFTGIIYMFGVMAYLLYYKSTPNFLLIPSLIFPWAILYIIYREKGMARLGFNPEKTKKSYPGYGIVLMGVALIPVFLVFKYLPVGNYLQAGYLITLMSCLLAIAILFALRKSVPFKKTSDKRTRNIMIGVIAVVYGFSAIIAINVAFDQSVVEQKVGVVIDKRPDSDYKKIEIKLKEGQVISETVSDRFYQTTKKGDKIIVHLKQGFLDIPWVLKIEKKRPNTLNKNK